MEMEQQAADTVLGGSHWGGAKELDFELHCQICHSIYENPRILSCGHSFCCECILTHLNSVLNTTKKNNCCPVCDERATVQDLRPNIALRDLSHIYKKNNKDQPGDLTPGSSNNRSNNTKSSSINSNNSSSNSSNSSICGIPIQKLFPPFSFQSHNPSSIKAEMAKMINERLSSNTNKSKGSTLNIDKLTDRTQLIHIYHKFKIKHDSQIGSLDPKSLEDVIKEVNKEMETIDKNKSKSSHKLFDQNNAKLAKELEELLKTGKLTWSTTPRINELYANLIRDALRSKKQTKLRASSSSSDSKANATQDPSSINEVKENNEMNSSSLSNSDGETGHQIMRVYPWLIVLSGSLDKPFYFNQITKLGQFKVPDDVIDVVRELIPFNFPNSNINSYSSSSSNIGSDVDHNSHDNDSNNDITNVLYSSNNNGTNLLSKSSLGSRANESKIVTFDCNVYEHREVDADKNESAEDLCVNLPSSSNTETNTTTAAASQTVVMTSAGSEYDGTISVDHSDPTDSITNDGLSSLPSTIQNSSSQYNSMDMSTAYTNDSIGSTNPLNQMNNNQSHHQSLPPTSTQTMVMTQQSSTQPNSFSFTLTDSQNQSSQQLSTQSPRDGNSFNFISCSNTSSPSIGSDSYFRNKYSGGNDSFYNDGIASGSPFVSVSGANTSFSSNNSALKNSERPLSASLSAAQDTEIPFTYLSQLMFNRRLSDKSVSTSKSESQSQSQSQSQNLLNESQFNNSESIDIESKCSVEFSYIDSGNISNPGDIEKCNNHSTCLDDSTPEKQTIPNNVTKFVEQAKIDKMDNSAFLSPQTIYRNINRLDESINSDRKNPSQLPTQVVSLNSASKRVVICDLSAEDDDDFESNQLDKVSPISNPLKIKKLLEQTMMSGETASSQPIEIKDVQMSKNSSFKINNEDDDDFVKDTKEIKKILSTGSQGIKPKMIDNDVLILDDDQDDSANSNSNSSNYVNNDDDDDFIKETSSELVKAGAASSSDGKPSMKGSYFSSKSSVTGANGTHRDNSSGNNEISSNSRADGSSSMWNCSMCTYLNTPKDLNCAMCGTPGPMSSTRVTRSLISSNYLSQSFSHNNNNSNNSNRSLKRSQSSQPTDGSLQKQSIFSIKPNKKSKQ